MDENEVQAETETPTADAPPVVAKEKIKRGPRKSKLVPNVAVKTPMTRKKRVKAAAGTEETTAAAAPTKATSPAAVQQSSALDEMQDLLRLEEENRDLRQMLSEKLRTENSTLRQKLGMN